MRVEFFNETSQAVFIMRYFFSFFLFFYSFFVFAESEFPQPYKGIEILPFDNGGWFANAAEFEAIFKTNKISTVIEVGSHFGLSARFIASHLPEDGKLYAVDHWAWFPLCYEQFLSNTIHAGLTQVIVPVRMDSLTAASHFRSLKDPVFPDLIYIDASHDTESVYQDLNAWYPLVKGRGILCGDDWSVEEVQIAVNRFAREMNMTVEGANNFWILRD